jgi:hypothetical protein
MDKTIFCEALYALPDNIIVKRRKSVVMPVVAIALGALVIVTGYSLPEGASTANWHSSLLLMGAAISIVGFVLMLGRLFGGEGRPCLGEIGEPLKITELSFARMQMREVMEAIDSGDVEALLSIPESQVAAVTVALCRTSDGHFAVCQPFEYIELEYRPLREAKILKR